MKWHLWHTVGVMLLSFLICAGCSPTSGTPSVSATIQPASTVATIAPTITSQPFATLTASPTSTLQTPTSLPVTPSPVPATQTPKPIIVTAKTDVNVRIGPGVNYPVIGALRKGEQHPLRGKNPDGTWWQINYREGNGWVSSFFAEISGDINNLPAVSSASTPTATSRPSTAASGRIPAYVSRVIDGDTITVLIGGKSYTVRYIGIDTPETVAPGQPVEWMGQEASAANKSLVEGKTAYLEKDVSEIDRYGRLLRYAYVGQVFVNAELVRRGYATVSTYPPDVKYQSLFLQMQQEAQVTRRGLWGARTLVVQPTAISPRSGNCDPAYPDVCIPSPPPDLDCRDISHKRFRVLPPDPHRFDGDHDGIGCE